MLILSFMHPKNHEYAKKLYVDHYVTIQLHSLQFRSGYAPSSSTNSSSLITFTREIRLCSVS